MSCHLPGRIGAGALLLWLFGFWSTSCGGNSTPASAPVTDEAAAAIPTAQTPVPLPEIGGFDAEVQRELREGHNALQVAIEAGNVTGEQYGRLGMQFAAYGLIDAAEAAYLNARRLEPELFRWGYYLGVLYDDSSRPEEAIDMLESALVLSPGYVAGLARLGGLLVDQDRATEARRRYADALALDQACHPCLVGLGQIALQERDFSVAVDYLEQAVTLAPWANTTRYPLAMAYRGRGDEEAAQAQLQVRADGILNTGMGRQIDRPGVYDALLEELAAVSTTGNVALEARGVLAAREGRWTDAIDDFNALVTADPENAVPRNLLAMALLTTGDRDGAKLQYEAAVRVDPTHARANLQLGILLVEEGLETEATVRFRQAVKFDPGSNLAYLNLAGALLRSGEAAEAVEVYGQLLQLDPSNAPARLGRAFSLIRDGRHGEAKARLQEDMQARPNELAFPHTLVRLLATSPEAGVRDGRLALELVQQVSAELQNGEVAETTAMVMAELGAFDRAVRYQELAVDLAEQAGRSDLSAQLQGMLAFYRQGQPSRRPFRDNAPVFFPAPFRPPGVFDEPAP